MHAVRLLQYEARAQTGADALHSACSRQTKLLNSIFSSVVVSRDYADDCVYGKAAVVVLFSSTFLVILVQVK